MHPIENCSNADIYEIACGAIGMLGICSIGSLRDNPHINRQTKSLLIGLGAINCITTLNSNSLRMCGAIFTYICSANLPPQDKLIQIVALGFFIGISSCVVDAWLPKDNFADVALSISDLVNGIIFAHIISTLWKHYSMLRGVNLPANEVSTYDAFLKVGVSTLAAALTQPLSVRQGLMSVATFTTLRSLTEDRSLTRFTEDVAKTALAVVASLWADLTLQSHCPDYFAHTLLCWIKNVVVCVSVNKLNT